jgi:predicted RNA polymerase sigma factor
MSILLWVRIVATARVHPNRPWRWLETTCRRRGWDRSTRRLADKAPAVRIRAASSLAEILDAIVGENSGISTDALRKIFVILSKCFFMK